MALTSMTAFAREAGHFGATRWAWEVKTVNGRGLDIRLRVPPGLEAAGEAARKHCAGALKRGTCQINLSISRDERATRVRINEDVMRAVLDALGALPTVPALAPLSVDGLLAVRGVVETVDEGSEPGSDEALHVILDNAFKVALAALGEARRAEGAVLAEVLRGQLERIAALTRDAERHPGRSPEAVRARLAAQVAALFETGASLDPARLHQEAVLIAAKADIREEIDRLFAHVGAATSLLAEKEPVGRKLDFLAQELGREANTLCAKANDIALSAIGLELKTVVEQFREQVQNVE